MTRLPFPVFLPIFLGACMYHRPAYTEPAWGNAPAPIVPEVTEVSMERMECPDRVCTYTTTKFLRTGQATRSWRTGKRPDSTSLGWLGSAEFARLAAQLITPASWGHYRGDTASHQEFENHSVLVSLATLCRRQVWSLDGEDVTDIHTEAVDSASAKVVWTPLRPVAMGLITDPAGTPALPAPPPSSRRPSP